MKKDISIVTLLERFPSNEVAIAWLEELLWKGKPKCAYCKNSNGISKQKVKKHFYWCPACRRHFSIRVGTPMERSKIPVNKWIVAIYYLIVSRKGISSCQLGRELEIRQASAWYMLQRIRYAMEQDTLKQLSGEVEIDEMYLGGLEKNKHEVKKRHSGRGSVGKQAVLGMKERSGKLVAVPIAKTDKETIQGIVKDHVKDGSKLYTDENKAYSGLESMYEKKSVNHSAKEFVLGMAHTNSIESVWSIIKRGFIGVYHHWSMKHCANYIAEFVFRLNEGFGYVMYGIEAVFLKMVGKTITYEELISKTAR